MWIPKFILDAARRQAEADAKASADLRVVQLSEENASLKNAVGALKSKMLKYVERDFIDFNIGDPIPTDPEKRRLYVGAVAGLHIDILRPKLQLMIAKVRELMDVPENSRETDLSLKGGSYALQELIRWGELMVSEDQAYNAGQNPSVPQDRSNKNK